MSYNGSGTFQINTTGQPVVTGTIISSTVFNALTADLATGLSTAVTKDGQTTPTANIPLGGFKITGLGNGTVATDAAAFGQIIAFGVPGYTTTVTAAATTTLSVTSTSQQYFTGVTTQTVTLPVASTLVLGLQFKIVNNSTGVVSVNSSGANLVVAIVPLSEVAVTCILASGTTAASWNVEYAGHTAITGTGSSVLSTAPTLAGATMTNDLTMTAASTFQAEGAAVASAATTDIWAVSDGDTIHITGTTTITSLGTAPQAGCWKQLIFDGVLILTDGVSMMLNNNGDNITVAANDLAYVYADTTTQMDVFVQRRSGAAAGLLLAPAPAADVTANGIVVPLTAGENLAVGQTVYIKSDGKMGLTDADAAATAPAVAMALGTILSDATGSFLLHGYVRNDAWAWTVGGAIYISTTAGAITQTAPSGTDDVIQKVGHATHADRMLFNPSVDYITAV